MTFDDWFYDQFDRTREAAEEAWNYQQERIDELEHKLALRDAFIAGVQFMETERLREKKKQIYEDLKDAVEECLGHGKCQDAGCPANYARDE